MTKPYEMFKTDNQVYFIGEGETMVVNVKDFSKLGRVLVQDENESGKLFYPNETAHWEYDPNGMDWGIPAWRCSECGCRNDMIPTYVSNAKGKPPITHEYINPLSWAGTKYCPGCGRRMEQE